jgi:hypothetical protein
MLLLRPCRVSHNCSSALRCSSGSIALLSSRVNQRAQHCSKLLSGWQHRLRGGWCSSSSRHRKCHWLLL